MMRILCAVSLAGLLGGCSLTMTGAIDPPGLPSRQVILASSPSQSAVQAAVLRAQVGQTVIVPPGKAIWQTPVYLDKGITLEGSGIGETVIYNPHTEIFDALIIVNAIPDQPFRITGFTFSGMRRRFADVGDCIVINGDTSQFRIDHNKFTDGGAHSIWIEGEAYGVIDHNQFIDASMEVISLEGGQTGDRSWTQPLDLGGPDAVYVETNLFSFTVKGDHAITGVNGARYVFRYNTVNSTAALTANQVDAHGNYFDERGTRSFEIYGNHLNTQGSYQVIDIRGGSGVIFDNTLSGSYYVPILFTQYRAWKNTYANGQPANTPCGYVDCTYPSIDQIHDVYVWNNAGNGKTVVPTVDDRGVGTSTAASPSYTYSSPGTYTVDLTVTDDNGATSSTSQTVTVSSTDSTSQAASGSATASSRPAASFTWSCSGLTCNFTNTSTDSTGTITSSSWTFGDSNVQNMIRLNRDYFLEPMPGYTPYPYPDPLTLRGPLAAPPFAARVILAAEGKGT